MNIPIAMICDDNYVVTAGVALSSIISSKQNSTHYTIYMLCAALSAEHEAMFRSFESDSVSIVILHTDTDHLAPLIKSHEGYDHVASPAALLKFELPNILEDEDKVLYLDIDIIVRTDLTELYSIPLDNDLLAAVVDSSAMYMPKYQFVDTYINSGVMLLNLSLMRHENTTDALIEAKQEHFTPALMDQTAYNYVCTGRIKALPIRYNLLGVVLDRGRSFWTIDDINARYGTSYIYYDEIFDDAAIIHFAAKYKPWINPFVRFAQDWYDIYHSLPSCFQTITDYSEILSQTHITISLTSCPERIGHVPEVIDSLLAQAAHADRIVLYLAKDQFPELDEALPESLRAYVDNGTVLVTWCEQDLKAHNGYFYAMQEYPDDIIITINDDEYLPESATEELLLCWVKYPQAISARRTDLITFDIDNKVLPCWEWIEGYNSVLQTPSHQLVAIGCGGILYPPHLFPSTTFNSEAIFSTALYASDLWLKANEVLNNIPVVLTTANANLRHIGDPQDSDLLVYDNLQDRNDDIFTSICNYFDIYYNVTSLIQNKISSDSDFYNITGQQPLIDFIKPLSHTMIDLAAQLKESNSKRAYYLKQRNKLRDENANLAARIKESNTKCEELSSSLKQAHEDKAELTSKLKESHAKQVELSSSLKQAHEDRAKFNDKLQQTYEEKSEINRKLQKTYAEKSEINTKLQQTYAEKSAINAKLQQTYAEKSELNKKLQTTYAEKSERGIQIKTQQETIEKLNKELSSIQNSWIYRIGRFFTWPVRKVRAIRSHTE